MGCNYSYMDSLVQDCSNSSADALELLQSCAKPSIWPNFNFEVRAWMMDYISLFYVNLIT